MSLRGSENQYFRAFRLINRVTVMPMTFFFAFETGMYGEKMIPWYIAAALLSICGGIMDNVSTARGMQTIKEVELSGQKVNVFEANHNLPERPTVKDIYGIKKTTVDSIYLISGIIFPPMGIILGVLRMGLAGLNEMTRRDIEKLIK